MISIHKLFIKHQQIGQIAYCKYLIRFSTTIRVYFKYVCNFQMVGISLVGILKVSNYLFKIFLCKCFEL